jgi:hypothetical protein
LHAAPDDIRDPKFAVFQDYLILYALKNNRWNPKPYTTVYTTSRDGVHWEPFQEIDEPKGWLFWRPKTLNGQIYYAAAYRWEHGKSALFNSSDGAHWSQVSEIYAGDRNDETDIEFLPDGYIIATARLEFSDSILGHPLGYTLIATSRPPYDTWQVRAKKQSHPAGWAISVSIPGSRLRSWKIPTCRARPVRTDGECLHPQAYLTFQGM